MKAIGFVSGIALGMAAAVAAVWARGTPSRNGR